MATWRELKEQLMRAVDALEADLIAVADALHARPETAFAEHEAARLLSGRLAQAGFEVELGVAGLETAFVARTRGEREGPTVALLAEYDALPGLGHACGHNLIAAAALGAALGLRAAMPDLPAALKVIGTPGEEGGGGKAIMVEAGVFSGVDAALMFHPSGRTMTRRQSLTSFKIAIEFYGQAAHAAARPDEGVNALEALILTYNGINALRQHLRDDARVHGVITHGGQAPNIVPDYAAARFYVRAADTAYCAEVVRRVRACAEGAAQATGARLSFTEYAPRYDAMVPNPKLAELVEANMALLGLEPRLPDADERMGSSDMGNVSQVVPAVHPYIAIGPDDLGGHTVEFSQAAASPAGHRGMIQAAKVLGLTALDLMLEPSHVEAAWAAFRERG